METESIRLLRELSEAFGPSGFEDDVAAIARREGTKWGDVKEDTLRNVYLYRRENTGNRPVVVLDAHSDEVGLTAVCAPQWPVTDRAFGRLGPGGIARADRTGTPPGWRFCAGSDCFGTAAFCEIHHARGRHGLPH